MKWSGTPITLCYLRTNFDYGKRFARTKFVVPWIHHQDILMLVFEQKINFAYLGFSRSLLSLMSVWSRFSICFGNGNSDKELIWESSATVLFFTVSARSCWISGVSTRALNSRLKQFCFRFKARVSVINVWTKKCKNHGLVTSLYHHEWLLVVIL